MSDTTHTIIALVRDQPGVLNRVASLFRRRAFNIESLAVGHCEIAGFSRMTIAVDGASTAVEQVTKQLRKLIPVVKVTDITQTELVARDLALIRVRATSETRNDILQVVSIFRANIVDVAPGSLIVEVTGDENKIDSLCELLRGYGVLEIVRTGRVAMTRGIESEADMAASPEASEAG